MERYYTDSKAFNGYITATFKFNILDIFHNSVVLSFKPNEIAIQTMRDKGMNEEDDSDIKGF